MQEREKKEKKTKDKSNYHDHVNGNGSCPYCGGHSDSCNGCNGTGYNISD